jgi:hypothetical protein
MTEEAPARRSLAPEESSGGDMAPETSIIDEQPEVVSDVVTAQSERLVVDPLPRLRLGKVREPPFETTHPGCAEGTIAVEDEKGRRLCHISMLRGAGSCVMRSASRLFAVNLRHAPDSCKILASAQRSSDLVSTL